MREQIDVPRLWRTGWGFFWKCWWRKILLTMSGDLNGCYWKPTLFLFFIFLLSSAHDIDFIFQMTWKDKVSKKKYCVLFFFFLSWTSSDLHQQTGCSRHTRPRRLSPILQRSVSAAVKWTAALSSFLLQSQSQSQGNGNGNVKRTRVCPNSTQLVGFLCFENLQFFNQRLTSLVERTESSSRLRTASVVTASWG